MAFTKIIIHTLVDADIRKAWDYYTKPEHIVNWNFASDDWCCPSAENDLRPGGKYTARMEAKDGSFGFDFAGIYKEVKEYQLLTYVLEDDRKVTTTFENMDGKTKVETTFDAEETNSLDLQKQGWSAILNNYKLYTEK